MDINLMLYPVMALVGWTFVVLMIIPYRRFKAGFAGQVKTRDFALGESDRVPDHVRIPNRNFMNLLEVPVLFYMVCLISYLSQQVDLTALILAWAYVVTRLLHSLVHLTYNGIRHRLGWFAAGNLVLLVFWLRLLLLL